MSIYSWLFKSEKAEAPRPPSRTNFFSTDIRIPQGTREDIIAKGIALSFQHPAQKFQAISPTGVALDSSAVALDSACPAPRLGQNYGGMSEGQFYWFAAQGFIGYQAMAMIAQHWFVNKACSMPAKDAIRKGYKVTVNDDVTIDPKALKFLEKLDKLYNINDTMLNAVRFKNVFGIRVCIPVVDSPDPSYYELPFNPDGILPYSYRGMSQVDPYWCTPELDAQAVINPESRHFYEPTYWRINGKRYHRSHLIILKGEEVADVLKPTYFYGGISLPQRLYERVYAAERTANEAPQLAMTKRLTVMGMDLTSMIGKAKEFFEKMRLWTEVRDNYGVKLVNPDDTIQQFDTSLNDLDAVIMTQFQIACGIAEVPVTKMLGTQMKGFSSGEGESDNYHESLESIRTHDLTALLERHHMCCIRSYVAPKFKIAPFETDVVWNPLDSPTEREEADINYVKAQTDQIYSGIGAVDGKAVRAKLIADEKSGYNGIDLDDVEEPDPIDDVEEIDPNQDEDLPNGQNNEIPAQ